MTARLILAAFALLLLQCKSQLQDGDGTPALENTYWRLTEVDGNPVHTPPGGREIYMRLTQVGDERRLTGHAGCNGLGGDYKIEDSTIRFQAITTRMYCEAQMADENAFTKMLTRADNYRLRGKSLELYAADELLGKFEAGAPESGEVKN